LGNGAGVIGGGDNASANSPTHFGPNGEIIRGDEAGRAGANGERANGAYANSAYRFYQGRWWYPMANNQWMYWNGTGWANFNGGVAAGAGDNVSGQYSSGYRGLNNPDANATANPNGNANVNANANLNANANVNGWYWRDGQWLWFNGTTFAPAR
jgi:hypothetical protein